MKIVKLKTKSKTISDFKDAAWKDVHYELHGREQDEERWKKKHFIYKSTEGKEILGVLLGDSRAGVLHIRELIVSKEHRDKGVGEALMKKIETDAKKSDVHFIYLVTGKKWKAHKFYKKLGYKVATDLNDYYDHTDFVLFTKNI